MMHFPNQSIINMPNTMINIRVCTLFEVQTFSLGQLFSETMYKCYTVLY